MSINNENTLPEGVLGNLDKVMWDYWNCDLWHKLLSEMEQKMKDLNK